MHNTLHLELIKQSLLGYIEQDEYLLANSNKTHPFDIKLRESGKDWPTKALSMIGMKRMNNIQECIERIVADNIEGNFIETGVWRGGACIFMQAVLKHYSQNKIRKIYVADSFKGMPPATNGDIDLTLYNKILSVDLNTVKNNFKKYDMLDDNIVFVEGYFENTMPKLSDIWALLRLDGDMYSSTKVVLNNLYHNLSIGGLIIIDDYNSITHCRKAVDEFRYENNINEKIFKVDEEAIFWQKLKL